MPERFDLAYTGPDDRPHRPVMVHRAILGSMERFIGVLTEHHAGAFPLWLAPVQVRVLPVGEGHHEASHALAGKLREDGYRVEVDDRAETLGRRIRDAEVEKVPYAVVWGDRESDGALAVRRRGGEGQATLSLDELLAELEAQLPATRV
jgi:threonyl-tRNA synthetase